MSQKEVTVQPTQEDLSQEHEIRVAKAKQLRKDGIEPWPSFKPVDSKAADLKNRAKELKILPTKL